MSSRSLTKLSSAGGSDAINSRNRSAERDRACAGGASLATVAPLRTISISSPARTRLRAAEKLRATSVAVILAIGRAYQINQTHLASHDDLACELEAMARVEAITVSEPVRRAITEH